jgi:putative transposase
LCEALGVSRGGFYAWLTRPRSKRSRDDEELGAKVRASFLGSDRTYGARRVWHDLAAEGVSCGLHRVERLMRLQALKARPRRRRLPPDVGERQAGAIAANVLDRGFAAPAPNRKWIADFTYVWTAEGWLYVAAVVDLFSRRVVGWSMSAGMSTRASCSIAHSARRAPWFSLLCLSFANLHRHKVYGRRIHHASGIEVAGAPSSNQQSRAFARSRGKVILSD